MRKNTIFDDVMKMPWPVGVVAAALVFFIFHTYQLVAPPTDFSKAIVPIVRMVAYFFIAVFLLASFFSFLTQKIRSKRFKNTRSMSDIRSLTWRQFESYIGEYFREQGFFVMETPEGPDNGVDLVLRKDGEKTYVQCKHWKTNRVGVDKIRELLGSMTAGGAQNGVFVASGNYTNPAREFARECGIRLIDGEELAGLFGDQAENLDQATDSAATDTHVTCPVCNAPMVRRVAKRGSNVGSSFWGCSKYPQCRGTRQL